VTTQLDDQIAAELRERGLRATRQRVAVLRALRRRKSHPTAAEIHDAVAERLPGVSLKTIYLVLDSLEEAGLTACVTAAGAPFRYEVLTEPHDHAHCRRCGRLFDIPARVFAQNEDLVGLPAGFEPERVSVRVQGLCRRCRGRAGS
jgi:Fur family peroxide stress response transcriptional regulator